MQEAITDPRREQKEKIRKRRGDFSAAKCT